MLDGIVSVEKDKINKNNETIIVSVKDQGQGIDPSIVSIHINIL